jgi:AAA15 family ATPase/GTPase
MLLKFKTQNFFSFNDETEFSMVPANLDQHLHQIYQVANLNVLKCAVLYGTNGVGKSNLVMALGFLRGLVVKGFTNDFELENTAFKMRDTEKPTFLAIEFLSEEVIYAYSICFEDKEIMEEKLSTVNAASTEEEVLFLRNSYMVNDTTVTFGPRYLEAEPKPVLSPSYGPEPDEPFLSHESALQFKEIENAYRWIDGLIALPTLTRLELSTDCFIDYPDFRPYLQSWMFKLNTGIVDFEILSCAYEDYEKGYELTEEALVDLYSNIAGDKTVRLQGTENAIVLMENEALVVKELVSFHSSPSGKKIAFDMEEESLGTNRIIDILVILYLVEKYPLTIVMDDLALNLDIKHFHKLLSYFLANTATLGQLIFTTNDSRLLDQELLRKDQMWMLSKNLHGETHLEQLNKMKIPTDGGIR